MSGVSSTTDFSMRLTAIPRLFFSAAGTASRKFSIVPGCTTFAMSSCVISGNSKERRRGVSLVFSAAPFAVFDAAGTAVSPPKALNAKNAGKIKTGYFI